MAANLKVRSFQIQEDLCDWANKNNITIVSISEDSEEIRLWYKENKDM